MKSSFKPILQIMMIVGLPMLAIGPVNGQAPAGLMRPAWFDEVPCKGKSTLVAPALTAAFSVLCLDYDARQLTPSDGDRDVKLGITSYTESAGRDLKLTGIAIKNPTVQPGLSFQPVEEAKQANT